MKTIEEINKDFSQFAKRSRRIRKQMEKLRQDMMKWAEALLIFESIEVDIEPAEEGLRSTWDGFMECEKHLKQQAGEDWP